MGSTWLSTASCEYSLVFGGADEGGVHPIVALVLDHDVRLQSGNDRNLFRIDAYYILESYIFIILGFEANSIKLFTAVIYRFS